jgi:hypothetical protein
MKTLLIIIMSVIFGMHSLNAQTVNKLQIDSFLIDHTLEFNKKQKPIFCSNLDSIIRLLVKNKTNYSRCSFGFFGGIINDSNLLSGGCKTYIFNKQKPFIFYNTNQNTDGYIIIEVLDGNSYF